MGTCAGIPKSYQLFDSIQVYACNSNLSIRVNTEDLLANLPQLFKCLIVYNTVHKKKSIASVHEGLAKRFVRVLAGGVQNLKLHSFAVDVDRCLE